MKHRTALPVAASVSAFALALVLGACSPGSDDEADGDAGATISHIHGVAVGPEDGKLYVATHDGIYTPDAEGHPELVGDRKDDFMGFALGKFGAFLASGHPAPGRDAPSNLGLIESTDTGRTWKDKSLSGKVDFHALEYAHETVYGYDSTNGLLRVSADGVTWDDRASLTALDIAVSPRDPDTVLATAEQGLLRSTDGGRTFASVTGPTPAFVSWATQDALFAVDPTGALSVSRDGGAGWSERGTVPGGAPQALTALDGQRLVVASQDGVYESRDGGKTFDRKLDVAASGDH
ncbi:F510_1955 family glycosylhydrolase [Streptomyces sp. NPDC059816]|uniref:F510_1955 family glycosylhydrolase n=1 Tax=Streptomyces sp. NPDC059816 TaxID=3346960 RepID=UPI0036466598